MAGTVNARSLLNSFADFKLLPATRASSKNLPLALPKNSIGPDWHGEQNQRHKPALLADRAHDARSRAAVACGALHLLHDRLVVRGNRRDSEFRLHEHYLVAVGL